MLGAGFVERGGHGVLPRHGPLFSRGMRPFHRRFDQKPVVPVVTASIHRIGQGGPAYRIKRPRRFVDSRRGPPDL